MSNHNAPRLHFTRPVLRRLHGALRGVLGMNLGDVNHQTRLLRYLGRPMTQMRKFIPLSMQGVSIDTNNFGDVKGEWVIPDNAGPTKILYFHGGGFVCMHPKLYRALTVPLARATGCKIFVPAYRQAPEHPFPAGLNDCVGAYTQLLHTGLKAHDIVLCGDSAGGNLVLAVMLRLLIREKAFQLPLCGVALSPWLDLTSHPVTGTLSQCLSRLKNKDTDWVLPEHNTPKLANLYCPGDDMQRLTEPYISPLFTRKDVLEKMPPMYFEAIRNEILYDDARLMHEKLLPRSQMHVWEDEPHTFQNLGERYPPALESYHRVRTFISDVQKGRFSQ